MYTLITEHRDLVIAELARINDLAKYFDLRKQLVSGTIDVATDQAFQRLYRNYWRMNVARLSDPFYATYFGVLAKSQRSGSVDLKDVVRLLASPDINAKRSLQLSFATKLAHMIDPRIPVYDSFVAAFYFYVTPAPDRSFEVRLDSYIAFHEFLRNEYQRVIREKLLDEALLAFRDRFGIGEDICDERLIDWLIWGWVSLLRSGSLQRGQATYS